VAGAALAEALHAMLEEALPGLLDVQPPQVSLSVDPGKLELDGTSPNPAATEPRAEGRREGLPFDPHEPTGPFRLGWPALPGARHVWLVRDDGHRDRLGDAEVRWHDDDPRAFSLDLAEGRDVTQVSSLAVLARAAVVRAGLTATRTVTLTLESTDADPLAAAEALVIGVIALNRQVLIDRSTVSYEDGDYGVEVRVDTLTVIRSESPDEGTRRLELRAGVEVTAARALREDEGRPIERVRSPGAHDSDRPMNIRIGV
jgi:hypothetical protein